MADKQHRLLTDADGLHELKGVSAASDGQIPVASGGSTVWQDPPQPSGYVKQGFWDYNDLATASSPIALSVAQTPYELSNDGLGTFSNTTYALAGIPDIWNSSTDRFDFDSGTGLNAGDTVDIRFDFEVTTTVANTAVEFYLELGIGGSSYQVTVNPLTNFKAAGTYNIVKWMGVYLGDNNTLQNPARVMALADNTGATVKVNGWYVRALHNT
jgi:hypothetical protein